MKRTRAAVLGAWLFVALPAGKAEAQPAEEAAPPIERIEILNNQYLQKETLLFYVSTKPGDPYDERKLREDFKRLWDTGFLDDLQVEVVDGQQGKVVRFKVTERKRIQIVDYRGSKDLTTSNIEDALKEKDAQVKIDTFYDPAKARKVEAIIKEMLAQKGRPFATVKHEAKNIGGSGQQLSFIIDDGPKAKLHEIVFDGNEVYDDAKLRAKMKKLKTPGLFNLSWLGGKTTYTEDKWLGGEEDPRGDRGRLEDFYLDHGYVTARVGQPKITYTDGKAGWFKKRPVKLMKLEIPVSEGDQYRMGELKFEGLTVLKEDFVRGYFKMVPGSVYNDSKFKKAYEKLRDVYGSLGYFQWTGGTQRKPDPEKKVVDITVKMEEDKQYFLGRINFTGNDSTRDKVIRREIYMNEGEVFNTEALKMSIKRVNQLGYFKPMEGAPDIRPSETADNKVDVTFKVEEQNRNQFTFGGGVSGLEGRFLNASFQTSNFLGQGETFQISAQTGKRTKNYQFAVSEPYLFDRPITAGIDLYKRKIIYQTYASANVLGYQDDRTGISFTTGLPVSRFSRLFLNYAYEIVDISQTQLDPNDPLNFQTPTISDSFLLEDYGRRRESRLSPSLVYNTVDSPFTPRRGMKLTASGQITGGPLGGTLNYLRPDLEGIVYIPHTKKTALGLRAQFGMIMPYASTAVIDPVTGRSSLPFYLRFYMGGEQQIRGYNIRAVGPREPSSLALVGGDKFGLFNAEYYVDVFGPVRFLLFFDAGQAYLKGQPMSFRSAVVSTGAELRFIMPVLNVPFRLIYAINPNADPLFAEKRTFRFAVGTTF